MAGNRGTVRLDRLFRKPSHGSSLFLFSTASSGSGLLGQGFVETFESFSPLPAGEVKDLLHNKLTLPWAIILGRHNYV